VGFNVSWIAVRGLPLREMARLLSLRVSEEDRSDIPNFPLSGAALPTGWSMILDDGADWMETALGSLPRLFLAQELLLAWALEGPMLSQAWHKPAGQERSDWMLTSEDGLPFDLRGRPPPDLLERAERLTRERLSAQGAGKHDGIFSYEVPLAAVEILTGYKVGYAEVEGQALTWHEVYW